MILIPLIATLVGIYFMKEYAKWYNPKDPVGNAPPAVIASLILVLSGALWVFYFLDTI